MVFRRRTKLTQIQNITVFGFNYRLLLSISSAFKCDYNIFPVLVRHFFLWSSLGVGLMFFRVLFKFTLNHNRFPINTKKLPDSHFIMREQKEVRNAFTIMSGIFQVIWNCHTLHFMLNIFINKISPAIFMFIIFFNRRAEAKAHFRVITTKKSKLRKSLTLFIFYIHFCMYIFFLHRYYCYMIQNSKPSDIMYKQLKTLAITVFSNVMYHEKEKDINHIRTCLFSLPRQIYTI